MCGDLRTLEDLREYLSKQFEADKQYESNYIVLITKYLNFIKINYNLSDEEKDYVLPIKSVNEEQSHTKTIINTKKAQEILLQWRKK